MDLSTTFQPNQTVCFVTGEIDIFTAPLLRTRLLAEARKRGARLVIDLSGVTFMDASGLAVLIGAQRAAHEQGGTLALRALTQGIGRLLEASGLSSAFTVLPGRLVRDDKAASLRA